MPRQHSQLIQDVLWQNLAWFKSSFFYISFVSVISEIKQWWDNGVPVALIFPAHYFVIVYRFRKVWVPATGSPAQLVLTSTISPSVFLTGRPDGLGRSIFCVFPHAHSLVCSLHFRSVTTSTLSSICWVFLVPYQSATNFLFIIYAQLPFFS